MSSKVNTSDLIKKLFKAWELGNLELMSQLFKKALSCDPLMLDQDSLENIIYILNQEPQPYYQLKCGNEAIHFLEQLRKKYPKNEKVLVALGNAYYAINDYSKSIDVFNFLVSLCPAPWTFFNLANAYYYDGNKKMAIYNYKQAIKHDPSNSVYHNALLETLGEYGQIGEMEETTGFLFALSKDLKKNGKDIEVQSIACLLVKIESFIDENYRGGKP